MRNIKLNTSKLEWADSQLSLTTIASGQLCQWKLVGWSSWFANSTRNWPTTENSAGIQCYNYNEIPCHWFEQFVFWASLISLTTFNSDMTIWDVLQIFCPLRQGGGCQLMQKNYHLQVNPLILSSQPSTAWKNRVESTSSTSLKNEQTCPLPKFYTHFCQGKATIFQGNDSPKKDSSKPPPHQN